MNRIAIVVALAAAAMFVAPSASRAQDAQVARGKYLVTIAGCSDCHTPGTFLGHPDMDKFLGGSDVGFAIPGLGVFPGRNLTPDKETGLGNWTDDQIIKAMTTGVRPDGRTLAPIMPVPAFAQLTPDDAKAIVAFLRSIKPVHNAVPGPFGPKEKSSVFVMAVLPPEVFAALPPPPPPPVHRSLDKSGGRTRE